MSTAQPEIFREGSKSHYFIELCLRLGWSSTDLRARLATLLAEPPNAGCHLVIAFGRDAWQQLSPAEMPENFIAFHPVLGRDERVAPATQADLLFWVHGDRHDHNYALARRIYAALADVATLELEVQGFNYLDSRDLTGFIDGTENPGGEEAREVALIPEGRAGAGGSFVLTQQWTHDLARFNALARQDQESVIGRTREDSVELEDAPASAHIRRTDVMIDGKALKIYRRSAPWGNLRECGLFFLAFSREQMRFALMLDRMFGLSEDGIMDRLTEFSAPVSGSYFFAPSVDALRRTSLVVTE